MSDFLVMIAMGFRKRKTSEWCISGACEKKTELLEAIQSCTTYSICIPLPNLPFPSPSLFCPPWFVPQSHIQPIFCLLTLCVNLSQIREVVVEWKMSSLYNQWCGSQADDQDYLYAIYLFLSHLKSPSQNSLYSYRSVILLSKHTKSVTNTFSTNNVKQIFHI